MVSKWPLNKKIGLLNLGEGSNGMLGKGQKLIGKYKI
jgi:hypothetical protein